MRLHPRHMIVNDASREFEGFVIDVLIKKHGLTYGEIFSLLGEQVARSAKYLIRQERHGDEDKKGDEA